MSTASTSPRTERFAGLTDVIWLQTSFIGDIVLTTAAMAALKKARPDVRQHLITTTAGFDILQNHPVLSSIHIFHKRNGFISSVMGVKKSLKQLTLPKAVVLQPHKSLRSTLLAKMLGYPTITYNETTASWLAQVKVPRVAVFHEAVRIGMLLEGLGIQRDVFMDAKPSLPKKPTPAAAAILTESNLKWIAIAPGSVWATKRWPTAKFAALTRKLLERRDLGIVLLGGPDDVDACNFIEASCQHESPTALGRILNLGGKTKLQDLLGVYPYLKLLISNDSSPIHYASAFNIPTVAIFGATVPAMGFGPLAEKSQIAQVDLACRPCGAHGHKRCPLKHFKCMQDLTVDDVLRRIDMV